jgi:proteasome lid subunit RPN8/RPN11
MFEMHEHATSSYPEECCGLLFGKFEGDSNRKRVSRSKKMENTFEKQERYRRYKIEPMSYMDSENEAFSEGEDIVGIYHSHPNSPAKPSLFDVENAWPSFSYVIIEVRDSKTIETRSWVLKKDRTEFLPEKIMIQS